MKKTVTSIVALALASMPVAAIPTSSASAQGASNLVQFCQNNGQIFFDTVGECVNLIRNGGLGFCKFLGSEIGYPWTLIIFDGEEFSEVEVNNLGECVSTIRILESRP